MNMTPCIWLFSALNSTSFSPSEALINQIAADSRLHTASCRAFDLHASRAADIWRADRQAPTPVPAKEHGLAVALLRAFPGVSAAEGTVYRHIRDTPGMSQAEQESLQELLGDGCSMLDYFNLGDSLIAGLAQLGFDAPHACAAREVIVANALRDVQRQPHLLAMMVHLRLLTLLNEQHWLRHSRADASLARLKASADAMHESHQAPAPDIRTQMLDAEPLRDGLLGFLLAEAGA